MTRSGDLRLAGARAAAYTVPTDAPEADGTFSWSATTLVLVEVEAGGFQGVGYTYSHASIVDLLLEPLLDKIASHDLLDTTGCRHEMRRAVRNFGGSGLAATAIAAIDCALWDLKAKVLDAPLAGLLGRRRDFVEIYGSGGFTSYDDGQLRAQLQAFVGDTGCRRVKMKIGSDPEADPHRISSARAAIAPSIQLMIDANGAFTPRAAIALAKACSAFQIDWFEEPVSSDDAAGLRFVRDHLPAGMDLAAGEYIFLLDDAARLLRRGSVDVLQADATRCGITGFLEVAALCEACHVDLSGHCAPAIHVGAACAAQRLRHLEWFHDHVRIEKMLLDGAPVAADGRIAPDMSRPGNGFAFRHADAKPFLQREGGKRWGK